MNALYLITDSPEPVIIFPADTAGPQVFPAVQVVPGRPDVPALAEADTVLQLVRVRLAGQPGCEVSGAAVQPDQGVTQEHSAQPRQAHVGPDTHPVRQGGRVVSLTSP